MNVAAKRGFTLVEIMIVVAIIALIAAISIPNILRARLATNETVAIASIRTLTTAMESYFSVQTPNAFPAGSGIAPLQILVNDRPSYIDTSFTNNNGLRQGYRYRIDTLLNNRYLIMAVPISFQTTGNRNFVYYNYDAGSIKAGTVYYQEPGVVTSWTPLQ